MIDVTNFGLRPAQPTNWQVGDVAGRWSLLGFGKRDGSPHFHAVARCSCGSPPRVVQVPNLTSGLSTNCGCVRREKMTTHGMANRQGGKRDPLYKVWHAMVDRCTNPRNEAYPRYGGRGIAVCERWSDPRAFVEDMGPTYSPGLTIERRENGAGYNPTNCYWGTRTEQTRNRRSTVMLTVQGETLPLGEWADRIKIDYRLIHQRIRNGWSVEASATTPAGKRGPRPKAVAAQSIRK